MKKADKHSSEISGTIVRYTTNKHHDIDGFVLDSQGRSLDVKFPPHTAKFIREIAAEQDAINLVVHEKPHPPHPGHRQAPGKLHLEIIEHPKSGRHFNVDSIKPPHPAETGRAVSFSIPHPQFIRGGKGNDITGIVVEGKFIHLHPGEYEASPDEMLAAPTLHVTAKQRTTGAGFVNADGYTVYHAQTVDIGKDRNTRPRPPKG